MNIRGNLVLIGGISFFFSLFSQRQTRLLRPRRRVRPVVKVGYSSVGEDYCKKSLGFTIFGNIYISIVTKNCVIMCCGSSGRVASDGIGKVVQALPCCCRV